MPGVVWLHTQASIDILLGVHILIVLHTVDNLVSEESDDVFVSPEPWPHNCQVSSEHSASLHWHNHSTLQTSAQRGCRQATDEVDAPQSRGMLGCR